MEKVELCKEVFEDVIAFSMSEPGAMDPHNMTFLKSNGEFFYVDYMFEDTYSILKEAFPALKECYWNGPMRSEAAAVTTIVIGGEGQETRIPRGWRHIYLDFGNHLPVKEALYGEAREILQGKDNCEITFDWVKILSAAGFTGKIDEISEKYYKQRTADEALAQKIAELNKIPEYRERISKVTGGLDELMAVAKEFGVDIDWLELKQFGLRRGAWTKRVPTQETAAGGNCE